jgi:hypothetical protein
LCGVEKRLSGPVSCGSPVASSMHMRNDMPQNDITFVEMMMWCYVTRCDGVWGKVMWCDVMRWDVGPWGGQMPLFLLKFRSERCCFNHRKLGNLPIGKQKVRPFEHMEEMKCHHVA